MAFLKYRTLLLILLAWLCLPSAYGLEADDTRMLSQPAVSMGHVAFVYAEDLWVCKLDGSDVRRLTTHEGVESKPRFSPDGSSLAFSAEYDGNVDIYLVPASGGVPKRLTWHPGPDLVQDFAPDGRSVLFTSPRAVHTNRYTQLFSVPTTGGHPEALPIPCAHKAVISTDGKKIAYVPIAEAFLQWKNYRGGRASRIWIYDRSDHSVVEVPQPDGRCNDTDPMWLGQHLGFRSDRNGEFNLYSFELATGQIKQHTEYKDFPVLSASAGRGRVVFEQGGYLYLMAPPGQEHPRIPIRVAADLIETRPRYVSGDRYIRSGSISPSGSRAVFGFRGEVVTVPAKKGDPRNLTETTNVHERDPVWSPSGRTIAYFSDESGEYLLHVAKQDGKGAVYRFELNGAGFYDSLKWSPDSKKIAFSDNSWTLYWVDLDTSKCTAIVTEPIYGPFKTQSCSWSPDSLWIAYTRVTETNFRQVHIYSLAQKKSWPVSDGLSDVGDPAFDASGKFLYMSASTDAGPVRQWFAMSNNDMRMSNELYVAVLKKGVESPLKRKSDEETVEEEKKEPPETEEQKPVEVVIDFDGLDQRIVAIPVGAGMYTSLRASEDGRLYYLKAAESGGGLGGMPESSLFRYDFEERKEELLASGVSAFDLTPDGKKVLVGSADGAWSIADTAPDLDISEGRLATDRIQVRIDPRAEWEHMFHEAWRINRDYFYDPNMHGADWDAMLKKYRVFLPDLAVRSDLNRLIQWLCSELAVGHHFVAGGDRREEVERVQGALLGADYEVANGRYRFQRIFGGLNWNPDLRSPLTEPGVDIREGEYLLAVQGVALAPPENLYSRFENLLGKTVEITVGPTPNGMNSRTVRVEPIGDESALRNRAWVEGNRKKVEEATGGRVAYVYVPNTTTLGHTYFKRYFFPQANKDAIIIDERYNGGGQVADYYLDILRRPYLCHWATRYGADIKTPLSSIQGPKVMLIDETAGSGGDFLPWAFRELKLGTLVGRRTWGGLVGMLGFPMLMDGGIVTAPNLGIWTEDGFIVENVGVPPDIEVEQYPAEVIAGRDPQLEKAIEIVLEQLEANPPEQRQRPPFPVRARR